MKLRIIYLVAAASLLAGCQSQNTGGSVENDKDVLTGGPVTGTSIGDLPPAVKEAVKQRAPHAEIADIDKTTRNGQVVYHISFSEPGINPKIYISEQGQILSNSDSHK